MALDFSQRVLVTNPTTFHLGRAIGIAGLVEVIVGGVTLYTGDIGLPALAWCAMGGPTLVIGVILVACGLTKA